MKQHLVFVLAFILLGGAFLVWFNVIDGRYLDQPFQLKNHVNPLALKVDKKVYHVGETPLILTAFCKKRLYFGSSVAWELHGANEKLTPYDNVIAPAAGAIKECLPPGEGFVMAPTRPIPPAEPKTCDAYFTAVSSVDIGAGRILQYTYKTEKFCIQ